MSLLTKIQDVACFNGIHLFKIPYGGGGRCFPGGKADQFHYQQCKHCGLFRARIEFASGRKVNTIWTDSLEDFSHENWDFLLDVYSK